VSTFAEQATGSVTVTGREELARYKAMWLAAAYSMHSTREFWKQNAIEYPALGEVAHCVYCISARSAQYGHDFSYVGHTISDHID